MPYLLLFTGMFARRKTAYLPFLALRESFLMIINILDIVRIYSKLQSDEQRY